MSQVEIFRSGRHQAMDGGAAIDFRLADLIATAAAYDPSLHEAPVVVGHPAHDQPAYGWVRGLRVAGDVLLADLGDLDPDFAALVQARRFAKVSASFYRPDSPANPKPGAWSLRHVGFLGAQPPAIKGLKTAQFADRGAVEFATAGGSEIDPVEVARAAQAYQHDQAAAGRQITVADAVHAILGRCR